MGESTYRFEWRDSSPAEKFRTGVCLHGHTMHSQECLNFLPRYLHLAPGISQIVSYYEHVRRVDFARAWWTPPLSPASAVELERSQIERLGLRSMVSLTDHDDIQAGLSLGITKDGRDTPLSVEWTVPYSRTIFHLGIHNIPRSSAAAWMQEMTAYTANPQEDKLPELLREFARVPEVLIVLNHPFWLEEGVLEEDHPVGLQRLLRECIAWVQAIEMNGTRPWRENALSVELSRHCGRPLISGGDRHACEPSACLNLTNARSFAEFAGEIHAGFSSILFLPQYREPMAQRVLEAARDILRTYPEYPGREHWSDRTFYRGDDGVARTVSEICRKPEAGMLSTAVAAVQFLAGTRFRPALRMMLSPRGEMYP